MIHCLLVEDNPHLPLLVRHYLKDVARVDAVRTATQALVAASENTYDLLILDVQLGGGPTGIDLLHALRRDQHYATVPIVAFTARIGQENERRLLREGFDEFLGKPFNREDIRNVFTRLTAHLPAA